MFNFAKINFSRNSYSKGIGILNKFTKNSLILNYSSIKFCFSTLNNHSYNAHNISISSINDLAFGNSNIYSEFGAKKKSVETSINEADVIDHIIENNPAEKSKKSTPTKTKTNNTLKTSNKPEKNSEKEKIQKENKNVKNKNEEKKIKVISTLDKGEKNAEGNSIYFKIFLYKIWEKFIVLWYFFYFSFILNLI